MYVEKVTRIEVSKEEIITLKQAEGILQEVCDVFDENCENCPFHDGLCNGQTPANILYKCINALPKESEEK